MFIIGHCLLFHSFIVKQFKQNKAPNPRDELMFCLNTTENLAKNLCFCILVSRLAIWPTGVGPKCSTRNESVKKYPTALGILQMIHVLFPLAVDAHMLAHTHVRTHTCLSCCFHCFLFSILQPAVSVLQLSSASGSHLHESQQTAISHQESCSQFTNCISR